MFTPSDSVTVTATNVKLTDKMGMQPILPITLPVKKINGAAHQCNGLLTLPDPDTDPYSDSDCCTMQKFHIGSDSDSDPLIEMYD